MKKTILIWIIKAACSWFRPACREVFSFKAGLSFPSILIRSVLPASLLLVVSFFNQAQDCFLIVVVVAILVLHWVHHFHLKDKHTTRICISTNVGEKCRSLNWNKVKEMVSLPVWVGRWSSLGSAWQQCPHPAPPCSPLTPDWLKTQHADRTFTNDELEHWRDGSKMFGVWIKLFSQTAAVCQRRWIQN